jgi:hypothetical protein
MKKGTDAPVPEPGLRELALDKLTRVLGAGQGQHAFNQALAAAQLTDIRTPEELYRFGDQLAKRGGFEAAVGRLLTVAAVMRGASGTEGRS